MFGCGTSGYVWSWVSTYTNCCVCHKLFAIAFRIFEGGQWPHVLVKNLAFPILTCHYDGFHFLTENIEATVTGKVSFVKRDGKSYVTVSEISTKCDAAHAEFDVMYYEHIPPLITNLIKKLVNSNWRLFKGIIYSRFEG